MSNELLEFLLNHEDFRRARLPSLYSDFSTLRTSNPDGFAANFTAWKHLLAAASLRGLTEPTKTTTGAHTTSPGSDRLTLKVDPSLMRALATTEWGMPGALPTVVSEAVTNRDFIPQKQFLESAESVYKTRLIDPWNVLHWGLQKSGLSEMWILQAVGLVTNPNAKDKKLVTEKFVVIENVERVANAVLKYMSKRLSKLDKIMTLEDFRGEIDGMVCGIESRPELSDLDVKVLLRFLTRDVGEVSIDKGVVKFKEPDGKLSPVTEDEVTIANLKAMIGRLNSEIEHLSEKMKTLSEKAKTAVSIRNETLARSALRSKALANVALAKKSNSLETLEKVLDSVQQAADNAEMARTLEASSKVLAQMNKEVGGVERVEKIIDELQEHMYDSNQISEMLNQPGEMSVDAEDVEDAFQDLLKQEEEEKRKKAEAEELKKKQEEEKQLEEVQKLLDAVSLDNDKLKDPVPDSEKMETSESKPEAEEQQQQEEKKKKEEEPEPKNMEEAIPAS